MRRDYSEAFPDSYVTDVIDSEGKSIFQETKMGYTATTGNFNLLESIRNVGEGIKYRANPAIWGSQAVDYLATMSEEHEFSSLGDSAKAAAGDIVISTAGAAAAGAAYVALTTAAGIAAKAAAAALAGKAVVATAPVSIPLALGAFVTSAAFKSGVVASGLFGAKMAAATHVVTGLDATYKHFREDSENLADYAEKIGWRYHHKVVQMAQSEAMQERGASQDSFSYGLGAAIGESAPFIIAAALLPGGLSLAKKGFAKYNVELFKKRSIPTVANNLTFAMSQAKNLGYREKWLGEALDNDLDFAAAMHVSSLVSSSYSAFDMYMVGGMFNEVGKKLTDRIVTDKIINYAMSNITSGALRGGLVEVAQEIGEQIIMTGFGGRETPLTIRQLAIVGLAGMLTGGVSGYAAYKTSRGAIEGSLSESLTKHLDEKGAAYTAEEINAISKDMYTEIMMDVHDTAAGVSEADKGDIYGGITGAKKKALDTFTEYYKTIGANAVEIAEINQIATNKVDPVLADIRKLAGDGATDTQKKSNKIQIDKMINEAISLQKKKETLYKKVQEDTINQLFQGDKLKTDISDNIVDTLSRNLAETVRLALGEDAISREAVGPMAKGDKKPAFIQALTADITHDIASLNAELKSLMIEHAEAQVDSAQAQEVKNKLREGINYIGKKISILEAGGRTVDTFAELSTKVRNMRDVMTEFYSEDFARPIIDVMSLYNIMVTSERSGDIGIDYLNNLKQVIDNALVEVQYSQEYKDAIAEVKEVKKEATAVKEDIIKLKARKKEMINELKALIRVANKSDKSKKQIDANVDKNIKKLVTEAAKVEALLEAKLTTIQDVITRYNEDGIYTGDYTFSKAAYNNLMNFSYKRNMRALSRSFKEGLRLPTAIKWELDKYLRSLGVDSKTRNDALQGLHKLVGTSDKVKNAAIHKIYNTVQEAVRQKQETAVRRFVTQSLDSIDKSVKAWDAFTLSDEHQILKILLEDFKNGVRHPDNVDKVNKTISKGREISLELKHGVLSHPSIGSINYNSFYSDPMKATDLAFRLERDILVGTALLGAEVKYIQGKTMDLVSRLTESAKEGRDLLTAAEFNKLTTEQRAEQIEKWAGGMPKALPFPTGVGIEVLLNTISPEVARTLEMRTGEYLKQANMMEVSNTFNEATHEAVASLLSGVDDATLLKYGVDASKSNDIRKLIKKFEKNKSLSSVDAQTLYHHVFESTEPFKIGGRSLSLGKAINLYGMLTTGDTKRTKAVVEVFAQVQNDGDLQGVVDFMASMEANPLAMSVLSSSKAIFADYATKLNTFLDQYAPHIPRVSEENYYPTRRTFEMGRDIENLSPTMSLEATPNKPISLEDSSILQARYISKEFLLDLDSTIKDTVQSYARTGETFINHYRLTELANTVFNNDDFKAVLRQRGFQESFIDTVKKHYTLLAEAKTMTDDAANSKHVKAAVEVTMKSILANPRQMLTQIASVATAMKNIGPAPVLLGIEKYIAAQTGSDPAAKAVLDAIRANPNMQARRDASAIGLQYGDMFDGSQPKIGWKGKVEKASGAFVKGGDLVANEIIALGYALTNTTDKGTPDTLGGIIAAGNNEQTTHSSQLGLMFRSKNIFNLTALAFQRTTSQIFDRLLVDTFIPMYKDIQNKRFGSAFVTASTGAVLAMVADMLIRIIRRGGEIDPEDFRRSLAATTTGPIYSEAIDKILWSVNSVASGKVDRDGSIMDSITPYVDVRMAMEALNHGTVNNDWTPFALSTASAAAKMLMLFGGDKQAMGIIASRIISPIQDYNFALSGVAEDYFSAEDIFGGSESFIDDIPGILRLITQRGRAIRSSYVRTDEAKAYAQYSELVWRTLENMGVYSEEDIEYMKGARYLGDRQLFDTRKEEEE